MIHSDGFQHLESAWRGLKMVIDRSDFRENIKVELLSVTKDELAEDFEDAPEIPKSGLYKHAYTAEFGQFGGQPYGVIVSNYAFNPSPQDMKLLQSVASVSAMSHAPFIAGAGPEFFGLDDFDGLPGLKDLEGIFEGPQNAKWQAFRESEDARNVGLTVPRFMLHQPYGEDNPVKAFGYTESVEGSNENFLWGNASYAMATNITRSFADYRWCPNIIGPQSGGMVSDMPVHKYEEHGEVKITEPTEVTLSDR